MFSVDFDFQELVVISGNQCAKPGYAWFSENQQGSRMEPKKRTCPGNAARDNNLTVTRLWKLQRAG